MSSRPKIGLKKVFAEREPGQVKAGQAVWDGKEKRPPRKGELYLSGASGFEMAYIAKADLDTPYFICRRVSS